MPAACATILFFLLDQKQAFLIGESHLAEGVLCHLLQTLDLHSRSLIPLCAVFAAGLALFVAVILLSTSLACSLSAKMATG